MQWVCYSYYSLFFQKISIFTFIEKVIWKILPRGVRKKKKLFDFFTPPTSLLGKFYIKMNESKYYERAKEKVEEKKKFHNHLRSYIVVNLIMLFTGVFFRGWMMAAFFWGIGLFSHYVKAYGFFGLGDYDEWEDQEIEREVKRMKAREKYRHNRNPPHNHSQNQEDDFDPDEYLDLNEPKPMPRKNYDESDLV